MLCTNFMSIKIAPYEIEHTNMDKQPIRRPSDGRVCADESRETVEKAKINGKWIIDEYLFNVHMCSSLAHPTNMHTQYKFLVEERVHKESI